MTAGGAGEGAISECHNCSRVPLDHTLADLVVGLRPVNVGFPAQPSPSKSAVELQEGILVGEDMQEVCLEVGDRRAVRARSS